MRAALDDNVAAGAGEPVWPLWLTDEAYRFHYTHIVAVAPWEPAHFEGAASLSNALPAQIPPKQFTPWPRRKFVHCIQNQ